MSSKPSPDASFLDDLLSRLEHSIRERAGWTHAQFQIAMIAALSILSVCCVGSFLIVAIPVGEIQPSATKTLVPLPTVIANSLPDLLKQNGFTISSQQIITVPNNVWLAREAVQLQLNKDNESGTVILLTYINADFAAQDAFRASLDAKWKIWKQFQYNNLLLLTSPNMPNALDNKLKSLFDKHLILQYRDFVLMSTSEP